jgi:hypothetical protein
VYTGRVEKVVFWLNMQIPFPCILVIHGRLLSGVQAHLLPRKFSEKKLSNEGDITNSAPKMTRNT